MIRGGFPPVLLAPVSFEALFLQRQQQQQHRAAAGQRIEDRAVTRVAVLGAGAWGTAIASVLAARLDVTLWARDRAQAEAMARTRRNERYLPNVEIPAAVKVSADFPARPISSWPPPRSPV